MQVNEEERAKLLIEIEVIERTPGMGGSCRNVENGGARR